MIISEQFILGRDLFCCKKTKQRLFGTTDVVGIGYVDQRVSGTIVCVKTAPAVFGRITANVGFNRIVMNVEQYGQKGAVTFDRHTVEPLLKKVPAPGILVVVPPDKSGPEALKEAGQMVGGRMD